MICKLTGKEGKGVKAHLIPKSFYKITQTPSLLISKKTYPKRLQAGLYDNQIVTSEGEKIFEKLDDYGSKLLIEGRKKFKPFVVENQIVGVGLEHYNYTNLKLFCLSMLWRISMSSLLEVSRVNLGSHESKIKEMILNSDAGTPDKYSVVMFRFVEEFTRGVLLYPAKEKLDGINYYRLNFSDYTALIKIDSQKTPEPFKSMQLIPDTPLLIANRNFAGGPEAKIFRNLFSANEHKLPLWYLDAANK